MIFLIAKILASCFFLIFRVTIQSYYMFLFLIECLISVAGGWQRFPLLVKVALGQSQVTPNVHIHVGPGGLGLPNEGARGWVGGLCAH